MATMYHPIQSAPRNVGKYSKITTYTSVHSNNVSNGIDESALHYQVRTFRKRSQTLSNVIIGFEKVT